MEKWLKWAIEIQSIAQAGIEYSNNVYDTERYERLREISAEMINEKSDISLDKVKNLFCNEIGYQTPKIDTRAVIFKDNKILLTHEKNGTWSLPGGWCDVLESVKSNTLKEVKEETGLDIWNLELCGVKQWFNDTEGRNVCFLFKTKSFSGELISSDEGENFWIKKSDILNYDLANNFDIMYKVFEDKNINEHYHSKDKDILK